MKYAPIAITLFTLTLSNCFASDETAVRGQAAAAPERPGEMLMNGNFAKGTAYWVVEESGATGKAVSNNEGPDKKPSLRLTVVTAGDKAWRLQLYHPGIKIEKGKAYELTFWARSDRTNSITVNCMQNHEPWDHHTQLNLPVSTEWKQLRFPFVGPWTDENARISFTDLGTTPGQLYWFADCSLTPALSH